MVPPRSSFALTRWRRVSLLLGALVLLVVGASAASGAPNARPTGYLDLVATSDSGQMRVAGWAVDPSRPTEPVDVHVYVDGQFRRGAPTSEPRTDVRRLHPGATTPGFDLTVQGPAGRVCVFAIGSTSNPLLGCSGSADSTRRPTPPPPTSQRPSDQPTLGWIDALTAADDRITVQGWAVDPDQASPVWILLSLDGNVVASFLADGSRPDVASARGVGPRHGFADSIAARLPDHGEVCLAARNDEGVATRLGCRSFGTPPSIAPPGSPPVPAGSGTGRRIVYSNSGQRVWMVEADGTLHDTYRVSGRAGVPRPGTYTVFSKSPVAWAGHDGITMRHMVRFARGRRLAIGFHSIPRYASGRPLQSISQLGTYQSAGCARQDDAKAAALYAWAPVGTTVVVLP